MCVRDKNEVDNNNNNHYYKGNNTCWSDPENNELSLCVCVCASVRGTIFYVYESGYASPLI